MLRPRPPAPPTAFTLADKARFLLSGVMIALGIVILWRTLPLGFAPPAILLSVAFIGFGVYRIWLGYTRWQLWRSRR